MQDLPAPLRYAVLGDIHANLEALRAVLEDAHRQRCNAFACVGDIIGYNSSPRECIQLVRDLGMHCVKGNHDDYASSDEPLPGLSSRAAAAMAWTRQQLDDADRLWLRRLPDVRLVGGFTLVHATLDGPHRWGYVFDKLDAASSFPYQNTQLGFFGHTHVPQAFICDQFVRGGTYSRFKIESGRKYFVNVGSVGEPRDGDPRAAYVIYDPAEGVIELRRLEFDASLTEEKNRAAGLPERRRTSR